MQEDQWKKLGLEPRPCPFCGDNSFIHLTLHGEADAEGQLVSMTCGVCGASGQTCYAQPDDERKQRLDATFWWNQRKG